MAQSVQAAVFHLPETEGVPNVKLEQLLIRDIHELECLVEIIATGLCHTDVAVAGRMQGQFPRVLGHEGAGYIRKIGSRVAAARQDLSEGDPVILSIPSCSVCPSCRSGHPAYCYDATKMTFEMFSGDDFSHVPSNDEHGTGHIYGGFFGQSSLATMATVHQSCIINVKGLIKGEAELILFAPFACGIQTGAGTVTELGKATKSDSVAIFGLGGVGLAAVMAARIIGCETIIAIDRVEERLQLARELGATHIINNMKTGAKTLEEIRNCANGIGTTLTIDTTGVISVIQTALAATAIRGRMIFLGMSHEKLTIDQTDFKMSGKTLLGSVQGDVVPSQYFRKLVAWYRQGLFPIQKLVTYYDARNVQRAISDMQEGVTVKPIILWT